MNSHNLPAAPEARARAGVQCDLVPRALDRWNPSVKSAAGDDPDRTITIYEPIGYDWWTGEGVTAKRISAALRAIGNDTDVIVNINSPGGDVFEGLAIYNLLREHKGMVTVNVIGLAASAASFIAMAGDVIRIGRAAFFMIHNAWVCACGNRNDLREIAEWLEPFDNTIADIYAMRSGVDIAEVIAQMDSETWIGGKEAVDKGWADALLESDAVKEEPAAEADRNVTMRRMDAALARAGIPRSERKSLTNEIKSSMLSAAGGGTPSADTTDTPSAVETAISASLQEAFENIQRIKGA
ncbi:MAG: Clp protease ClpP [Gammaproteobacteria bacterium]|nr:Clp protease ClpP [Gammaproteobacteria bacterium]